MGGVGGGNGESNKRWRGGKNTFWISIFVTLEIFRSFLLSCNNHHHNQGGRKEGALPLLDFTVSEKGMKRNGILLLNDPNGKLCIQLLGTWKSPLGSNRKDWRKRPPRRVGRGQPKHPTFFRVDPFKNSSPFHWVHNEQIQTQGEKSPSSRRRRRTSRRVT